MTATGLTMWALTLIIGLIAAAVVSLLSRHMDDDGSDQ